MDTAALPTAYGSPLYTGHRPRSDAALVGAIHRAGGVVIGKTTSTEFAYLHPTATRNPNAPGRTPGGSSAGSAAAVAAGLVELAIGTQTGGSVIRPASYCGVVGCKPSFGWLPTAGVRCFSWSLDTVGLFTRTVADAAFFAQALAGRRFAATRSAPTAAPRFGVVTDYPWGPLSPAMATALQEAATRLRTAGHTVREVRLPAWAAEAFEAQATVQGWEAVRSLHTELTQHADALSPLLRDYLREASRTIGDADYDAAQRITAAAREAMADDGLAAHGVDVLLTPGAPDEAPLLSEHSTGAASYNRLWTLLGAPASACRPARPARRAAGSAGDRRARRRCRVPARSGRARSTAAAAAALRPAPGYFLQSPPTDTEPSLHSVRRGSPRGRSVTVGAGAAATEPSSPRV
ncbi:Glutamyl-tRNA(Gln) amidotransferase subunit A [Methylibium sp. T29-B]|nr:Glutamyl-tRNA(Gln) amidotransferase subunit A [Methylibium sp. T29-B]